MKNILIYAPNALTSGVTNILYSLHKDMDPQKVCISVASWPENKTLKKLSESFKGEFYSFKTYYLRHPFRYRKDFLSILTCKKFDVIVLNLSYLLTLFPIISAQKMHIDKIIVYAHSSNVESTSYIKRKILFLLHYINKYRLTSYNLKRIACSYNANNWFFGKYNDVTIIKNAIDITEYRYQAALRTKKREKNHVSQKYVIGHVGRLSYPKNQIFLIEICKFYFQINPNAVLWIIGDGPLKNTIERAIHKYNLTEKVVLWGNRKNVSDFLQCMDLFIMPSHFEGAPVALIEAQANGLPCIVSDTISEECIVNQNVIRKSLDCSASEWAQEMESLSSSKREVRAKENLIEQGWDLCNVSEQLQKIYIT